MSPSISSRYYSRNSRSSATSSQPHPPVPASRRPPNRLAALVMRSTREVGLVASDFSDHNLSRFIVGAEREARRQGYSVVITSVDPDGSGGELALRALMGRRVDGVLL